MQIYNEMRVYMVHQDIGQMTVAWYDNSRTAGGKLKTPLKDQTPLRRSHKIPVEAEENNWTREQLRDFWLLEVEDVADIPQWAEEEAEDTVMEERVVIKPRSR